MFLLREGLEMNRLYRFTNRNNRVNHGLITELVDGGVYVMLDQFDISEKVQLPARYAYVSLTPNPYTLSQATRTEVLPLTYDIRWQDERIARVATIMLDGKFDEWWEKNQSRVMAALYKRPE